MNIYKILDLTQHLPTDLELLKIQSYIENPPLRIVKKRKIDGFLLYNGTYDPSKDCLKLLDEGKILEMMMMLKTSDHIKFSKEWSIYWSLYFLSKSVLTRNYRGFLSLVTEYQPENNLAILAGYYQDDYIFDKIFKEVLARASRHELIYSDHELRDLLVGASMSNWHSKLEMLRKISKEIGREYEYNNTWQLGQDSLLR